MYVPSCEVLCMRSEYDANMLLVASLPEERREEWLLAQFIDEQIDALAAGALHHEVNVLMYNRGVCEAVRYRVLAGGGRKHHREKELP